MQQEGFHKYINSKRKRREYVNPLLNGAGQLVTNYMDKAEVLNLRDCDMSRLL